VSRSTRTHCLSYSCDWWHFSGQCRQTVAEPETHNFVLNNGWTLGIGLMLLIWGLSTLHFYCYFIIESVRCWSCRKTKGKTSNNFYLFCILLYIYIGILLTYSYWIFDLLYFFLVKNTYNICYYYFYITCALQNINLASDC